MLNFSVAFLFTLFYWKDIHSFPSAVFKKGTYILTIILNTNLILALTMTLNLVLITNLVKGWMYPGYFTILL